MNQLVLSVVIVNFDDLTDLGCDEHLGRRHFCMIGPARFDYFLTFLLLLSFDATCINRSVTIWCIYLLGNSLLMIFTTSSTIKWIVSNLTFTTSFSWQNNGRIDLVIDRLQKMVDAAQLLLHAIVYLNYLTHSLFVLLHHLFNSGVLI